MPTLFDMQHQVDEIANRRDFLRKAFMAHWVNMTTGDYVEFGCAGATTFRCAFQASRANLLEPHLWAFDSFAGLPPGNSTDEHPRWLPGAMSMTCAEFVASLDFHGVPREHYTIVEGFYSETLSPDNPHRGGYCPDVSIAYIDCDMYESAAAALGFLKNRLKNGMILAFDDYHCWWPNGVAGERIAFLELEREVRADFNFLPLYSFGWHGQSFVVESRRHLRGLYPVGHFEAPP